MLTGTSSPNPLGHRVEFGAIVEQPQAADRRPRFDRVGSRRYNHSMPAHFLVGIAGGERKYEAIRGALRGGLINVLITDGDTAQRLVAEDLASRQSAEVG
jgi:hypothetical protein